jgi:myo-inositol 2-dehydrogenase/D-chiro-inositol 1-dehydrogenase
VYRSASLADEAVRFVESFREDSKKAATGVSAPLAEPFGVVAPLHEEIASPQSFPKLTQEGPLRVVLVGAGRMGSIRAGSIATHPRMKLVAVVDPFFETAKTLGATLKVPAFDNLKEAIALGVDGVWIAASTPSHLELITEAAKAKKHIYCEKPIGLTMEEIDLAFKVAHEEGVYLLCGWMRRFDAGYASVFDATQGEGFGRPFILNCVNGDHPLPPVAVMASLGSIYHDLMVHDIDTCTYFTKEFPVSVYATGNTFIPELKPAGVLDGGALVFTYPSGATAMISARRRSVIGYDQRVEVVGRGGQMATLNNYVLTPVVTSKAGGSDFGKINYSFPDRFAQAYATEVDHFARVLFDGERPRSNYRECRQVAIVCDAALKSYQAGKAVVLPPFV